MKNVEKSEKSREEIIVRTSIIGIVVNLILVAFKATIGILVNSIAITLDAVNNLTDALSSIITIIGTKLAGRKPDADLGQALLAVIGLGLAGGIALIGGAVKLGEKVLDLQVKAYEKIETERESRREAVRQIAENEMEFGVDPEASDKEEN